MTVKKNKALGKGLNALLAKESIPGNEGRTVLELSVNDIDPNAMQPRKHFDDSKLRELADSIKENGVLQPIIVTKVGERFHIVAGERRWRASRLAGKKTIPAIVRELSEKEVLQQALIENIQRQDLNALEEAEALERLLDDYKMTQENLAKVVGRSRPAVANSLRLLKLNKHLQQYLRNEQISAGHARALLALPDAVVQESVAERIISQELSVRETEKWVNHLLNPKNPTPKKQKDSAYLLSIKKVEEELSAQLGTKVSLKDKKNKGAIVIEYYSADELERLLELLKS